MLLGGKSLKIIDLLCTEFMPICFKVILVISECTFMIPAKFAQKLKRPLLILYEAVFISKLTCQLSSFFVQNFVQTTSTLCKQRQLCAKNDDNFARTTSTLQGQRRLCKDNDNFARTTSTLQGQRPLCKDNVDFARTTTTLQRTTTSLQRTTTTLSEVHV